MGSFIQQHISIPTLLFFQIFWIAILLWFTWKLIKFGLMKSLWYSTGFASIASFTLLVYTEDSQLDWVCILLSFLPVLILAAGIGVRAVVNCFANVDDGGSVNSAERQRTLEMVEQGKITAEEGTELLEALGRSNAMLGQDKFSRLDMLILAGIATAVFGFFLPWIQIMILNLPQFRSEQMGGIINPLDSLIRTVHNGGGGIGYQYQAGYQVGAIGWAVLVFAILAAIPVFITPKNFLYKMSMLQIFLLVLGGLLVINIMIRAGGSMKIGLPICLVGIVLALAACFGKFKKLAA